MLSIFSLSETLIGQYLPYLVTVRSTIAVSPTPLLMSNPFSKELSPHLFTFSLQPAIFSSCVYLSSSPPRPSPPRWNTSPPKHSIPSSYLTIPTACVEREGGGAPHHHYSGYNGIERTCVSLITVHIWAVFLFGL